MTVDELDFGDGPVKVALNVYTLTVYEQAFDGADLVKDLYGRIDVNDEGFDGSTLDYTKRDWAKVPRILWACMRAADQTVPRYDQWAREAGDVNLGAAWVALVELADRRLFRTGQTAPA